MARGGSRFGAGRPGWRGKIEHSLRLDVRELARRRLLGPGTRSTWRWSRTDTSEETASIGIRGEENRIVLHYHTRNSNNPTPVIYPVALTYTVCNCGGSRPWFACPRCGRRCAVIAYGWSRWACRACQNLAYFSESEDAIGRLWRKQRKLEKRLGEHWRRPNGMHRATYERILEKLVGIEARKDGLFEQAVSRLLGRSFQGR